MEAKVVVTAEGVPMWNDGSNQVHNGIQFRSFVEAKHKPIPNIRVKRILEPFSVDGGPVIEGGYIMEVDGRWVGMSDAEFSEHWELTGNAL